MIWQDVILCDGVGCPSRAVKRVAITFAGQPTKRRNVCLPHLDRLRANTIEQEDRVLQMLFGPFTVAEEEDL